MFIWKLHSVVWLIATLIWWHVECYIYLGTNEVKSLRRITMWQNAEEMMFMHMGKNIYDTHI